MSGFVLVAALLCHAFRSLLLLLLAVWFCSSGNNCIFSTHIHSYVISFIVGFGSNLFYSGSCLQLFAPARLLSYFLFFFPNQTRFQLLFSSLTFFFFFFFSFSFYLTSSVFAGSQLFFFFFFRLIFAILFPVRSNLHYFTKAYDQKRFHTIHYHPPTF